MKVLVVSDTHLRDGTVDRMPREVWAMAADADQILHAGDVLDQAVLDALAAHAPVTAVLGNNDYGLERQLPEVAAIRLGGVEVAMIHDSGATTGRAARMRRRFPQARIVVFGHSHDPQCDDDGDLLLFNPGSPIQRRRQPVHTVGWLELDAGEIRGAEIIPVGPLA